MKKAHWLGSLTVSALLALLIAVMVQESLAHRYDAPPADKMGGGAGQLGQPQALGVDPNGNGPTAGQDRNSPRREAGAPSVGDSTTPASLHVFTITSDGEQLAACQVAVRAATMGGGVIIAQEVGGREIAPGQHVFAALPPGDYEVLCKVPYSDKPVGAFSWNGVADQQEHVRIADRADLLGGVLRRGGDPVQGAFVCPIGGNRPRQTVGYWCSTDAEGRFLFMRATGNSGVEASFHLRDDLGTGGFADSEVPVVLRWGELGRVVTLAQRAGVEVRLLNVDGQPRADFTVEAVTTNDHGSVTRKAAALAGVARLDGLPTGFARLVATVEDDEPAVFGTVAVASNGSGAATLVTPASAPLVGEVVMPSGGDAPNGSVVSLALHLSANDIAASGLDLTRGEPVPELRQQQTIRGRNFAFRCDPAQEYLLRVVVAGCQPYEVRVRATGQEFSPVVAQMQFSRGLRTRVQPAEAVDWMAAYAHQQAAGATCSAGTFSLDVLSTSGGRALTTSATADAQGRIEFLGLTDGRWVLSLNGPLGRVHLHTMAQQTDTMVELPPLDLEPLRPCRVDVALRLRQEGFTARTLVVFPEGVGGMEMQLRGRAGAEVLLPAGRYRFGVRLANSLGALLFSDLSPIDVGTAGVTRTTLTVDLRRVEVRLVDLATGKGVPDALLSIDEERRNNSFRTFATDANGRAVIYPCPLVEFGLSVTILPRPNWTFATRLLADSVDVVEVALPDLRRPK